MPGVRADGFLYNMVRAMVGTCVYAADGKFSPDDVPAILEGRNCTAAGPTVPAGGLSYDQTLVSGGRPIAHSPALM